MPKGGKLVFKGGEAVVSAKAKKKEKRRWKREKASARAKMASVASEGAEEVASSEVHGEPEEEMRPILGIGRITSSATAVHGHDTKFMDEVHSGDAIIITHPTTLREETRIIKMVLSNISIGISSPFSSDLISTTRFRYIKAPRVEISAEVKAKDAKRQKVQEDDRAFGTYAGAGGTRLVYRERTPAGNYRIIEEHVDKAMTREEMLDRRSTKKADRHCN